MPVTPEFHAQILRYYHVERWRTGKGYRPRSVDALRPYLAQIEAHILELGKIQFVRKDEPAKLELVAAA